MSLSVRKLIALLLAIWLPLFSGSVLAASVSMQHGSGHPAGDIAAMQTMDGCDNHHSVQDKPSDQHPCNGVCHLACSCYLGVQEITALVALQADGSVTPYLLSFHSISSIPLLPPPLSFA